VYDIIFEAPKFEDGKMDLPQWHEIVKTSVANEYSPQNPDWYYVRAAALARKVYLRGGAGIGAYSKVFGGNYRRGARTEHFQRASRNIIRKALQQLQQLGLVDIKKDQKGRWMTQEGRRVLDTIAGSCVTRA